MSLETIKGDVIARDMERKKELKEILWHNGFQTDIIQHDDVCCTVRFDYDGRLYLSTEKLAEKLAPYIKSGNVFVTAKNHESYQKISYFSIESLKGSKSYGYRIFNGHIVYDDDPQLLPF